MLFALAAAPPRAHAQPAPAGTRIVNQALVDYVGAAGGVTSRSNPVSTRVLPFYAVRITPPGTVSSPAHTLAGAPGDTVYCHFDVENLGNDRDSLSVSYALPPPVAWSPADVFLFADADGDGAFDPGEDDPAAFTADAGAAAALDVGVVIPPGAAGDVFVAAEAASHFDASAADRSVFRVTATGSAPSVLHLGPAGNPRALPGGDGSPDDVTDGAVGYTETSFTFENDLLNGAPFPQDVEVVVPAGASLAPGLVLSIADSSGARIPASPSGTRRFLLGTVPPGATERFRVTVSSATGEPLFKLAPSVLAIAVTARAVADTTVRNTTTDRLVPPQEVNPGAAIALRQTFHETVVSAGDVVTLVVTVQNITDSLRVDSLFVTEFVQPQLSFASSPDFVLADGRLQWDAGSLAGGESKTAVAKFVTNGRVRVGKAKAVGRAGGTAESGDDVSAGPVVSSVRIENDVFGDEGVVFGDVFVDSDGDGRRGSREAGVGNVAVYLESGEYAVTDSSGAFSIPRAFSGYRMVRLDASGLPGHVRPPADGPRRGDERLVHLLPGGHARVSFPLVPAHPDATPPQPAVDEHALSVQEKVSIRRKETPVPARSIPSSHFGMGRAELGGGADLLVEPVAEFMNDHPGWRLLVEGHTDSIPIHTAEFPSNTELSIARAEAVRNRVVEHGIDPARILVRGYGDRFPVASNTTIEGRRHNRRVELTFVPPDYEPAGGPGVRASSTVPDVSRLGGTVAATVFWELTTADPAPRAMALSLSVPDGIELRDVAVRSRGREFSLAGSRGTVDGFSKWSPVAIRVDVECAESDTARIADIAATVAVAGDTATVQPLQRGGADSTAWYDAMHWTSPRAVEAAPAGVVTQGVPDTASDSAAVAFLEPREGTVFTNRDRVRVRARLPLGTHTRLFAGDVAVPDSRIGQRTVDVARGEEQIVWYGVQIRPGWNTLVLESRLLAGGVETDTVRVALSSRTAAVTARRSRVLVPADGRAAEVLVFDVVDVLGLPVADGVVATVVEGDALVDVADSRPDTRGLQVLVRGGCVELPTAARNDTGRGTVVVECDGFRAGTDVTYVSARRPLFATGVVDVRVGAYNATGEGSGEGLEGFDDGLQAKADSRLFVQGAMPHGVNLTARLDARKRYDDPLLKDINTDREYPIYGDASSLHFAAPSQGGNFVSLDRGDSFLRYGDFRTPLEQGEFLAYHRAATGVTTALIHGRSAFHSFVTRTDFSTHQDEIAADGTSGFYYLSRAPVVEHSERIVLETRDRYQSEKVLEVRPMVRNRDYTISYFDGSVLFKEPVAAFDRHFNPVTIVATYEVETRRDAQYLYGARGDYAGGANWRLGSTAVASTGDGQNYALYGADAEADVAGLHLSGEVARSEDEAAGNGNAFKVGARFENDLQQHEVYLRRVDGDFNNPSLRGSSSELASLKTGFQSGIAVGRDIRLDADGFVHRLDRTGETRENLRVVSAYRHGGRARFEFTGGARLARHERPEDDRRAVLAVAGLALGEDAPGHAAVSTLWEKNLAGESVEDYPDRIKTLASAPLGERFRLVAGHEYLTASGRAGSHQATAGVESQVSGDTRAFTRYSMSRTAGDERMGAVTGLEHRLRLRADMSGMVGVEGYRSLSDRPDDEYVTVKSGIDMREREHYVVEGQYEYRWQTRRTKHLVRFNAVRQLRSGFATLLKSVFSIAPDDEDEDELGVHTNLAVAHRPSAGAVHSLWMLRNDYERYTPANPDAITWRLVFSGDVNIMPAVDHELRMKYAFKHVENWSYDDSHTVNADLFLAQYLYYFARGWDVDVWGRLVNQRGGGSLEAGTGVEVGRMFFRGLRVAAGYSINGFEDPDFAGTDAWAGGFGVRVQLLLSDRLLDEVGVGRR